MGSSTNRSAVTVANRTLNSLASFLQYAELIKSAEQVRNIRCILQNIIVIEQHDKATHAGFSCKTKSRKQRANESRELTADKGNKSAEIVILKVREDDRPNF